MSHDLFLRNYTEDLVDEAIKKLWSKSANLCKCKRCYYDTMALSLNRLPSKYVVTDSGEVYMKLNNFMSQAQVDVMKEVTKASVIVNNKYSHSLDEVVYE